jgi:hypothetical protein
MEAEGKPLESKSLDTVHIEKLIGPRRSVRKCRVIISLGVSLLSAGLLALPDSQLLIPSQNQGQTGPNALPGFLHTFSSLSEIAMTRLSAYSAYAASTSVAGSLMRSWQSAGLSSRRQR